MRAQVFLERGVEAGGAAASFLLPLQEGPSWAKQPGQTISGLFHLSSLRPPSCTKGEEGKIVHTKNSRKTEEEEEGHKKLLRGSSSPPTILKSRTVFSPSSLFLPSSPRPITIVLLSQKLSLHLRRKKGGKEDGWSD